MTWEEKKEDSFSKVREISDRVCPSFPPLMPRNISPDFLLTHGGDGLRRIEKSFQFLGGSDRGFELQGMQTPRAPGV